MRCAPEVPTLMIKLALLLIASAAFALPASGQCLEVRVIDPSGVVLSNATVSIGERQMPTDDAGAANFCDLGAGPHTLTVQAPGFEAHTRQVSGAEGSITVTLQIPVVTETVDVVAVGTRTEGRQPLESPVPVDLIVGERLRRSGQMETGRALQMLAPSFNFTSSSITDGTDAVRPATLRGLGPDQTLVLVNGKRRHNSALVHVLDTVGRGTAGTDMNAIPIAAIERIEVLSDGAAAQYGSDAIAGVINIVLKNSPGFSWDTSWGQTYAGDGDTFTNSLHYGFGFGDGGFLNLTFENRDRGDTNRSGPWGWPFYLPVACGPGEPEEHFFGGCYDDREYTIDRDVIRLGDARSEHYTGYYNFSAPLGENVRFYSFGGVSVRDNNSAGFYRVPSVFDNRIVYEKYPNGFLPEINTDVDDISAAGGIEWQTRGGWTFDLSVNHGRNAFDFFISSSNNASYGARSPTEADSGGLQFEQTTFNFDTSRLFEYAGRTMNLALGGEVRRDSFGIRQGEPVSYLHCLDDPSVAPADCDPRGRGAALGIQVFPGFQPSNEVNRSRFNTAAYADLEWVFNGKFVLGAAGRFERYSDFGATVTGKLLARYDFTPRFAVRGNVNTGFRAPSLHQLYFSKVDTLSVESDDGSTVLAEVGTFRNDSDLVKALGVPTLQQETSLNLSGGVVARFGKTSSLTVDAFRVKVDDRIVFSANVTAADLSPVSPQAAAFMQANRVEGAQFFANVAQTVTNGVEFAFDSVHSWRNGSVLDLGFSGAYIDTDLAEDGIRLPSSLAGLEDTLFAPADRSILEDWQPNTRLQALAEYRRGRFRFGGGLRYFGKYTLWDVLGLISRDRHQEFGGEWLTDVHFGIRMFRKTELTIGANNLFNVYPDNNEFNNLFGTQWKDTGGPPYAPVVDSAGRTIVDSAGIFPYARTAPFGINGGYYYVRYSIRF